MSFYDYMYECGHELKTTFWQDFTTADLFGVAGVSETFNLAFNEWRENYEYLTELVIVLNLKIWQHHKKNNALAELYNKLWQYADQWAQDHLKGDELTYYYNTTD